MSEQEFRISPEALAQRTGLGDAEDRVTETPIDRQVTTYTERRRAVIHLSDSDLHAFLGLPEGLRVVAVSTEFNICAVSLLVEGEELEPVLEWAYPPIISGRTVREVVEVDGQRFWRLVWEPVDETREAA